MRFLLVRIKRTQISGVRHYDYPPEYNARKVQFGPIYESTLPENEKKILARGGKDEYCLIGVKDEDAPSFLKSDDITEVTEEEAREIGNKWIKRFVTVVDARKVMMITAKAALGKSLTKAERDALDPDKPEIGINKTKSFDEVLDEFLASAK
ncbi:hypothetical protein DRO59_00125 [Candidatus Bathyarchaeota archaeon]|nr:MAG: hypothetical protein DRO59_00125 [Candidatus Bathyarchaeota archaeon]